MTKQFDLRFNFALHQKYDIASCAPSTKAKKTSCFTLLALDRIIILILPHNPLVKKFEIINNSELKTLPALDRTIWSQRNFIWRQRNFSAIETYEVGLGPDKNLNSFETLSRNCSTVSTMSTLHPDKEAPFRFSHVATLTS